MLEIKKLSVKLNNKIIIRDLNLTVNAGEKHIIMGRNGSGKSTLVNTIVGSKSYKIVKGQIFFHNKNINDLSIEHRAKLGIFLSYQDPVEIPNVTWGNFLKTINNNKRKNSTKKFLSRLYRLIKILNINKNFLNRGVNEGFSGGEKKKLEVLQILLLKPKLIILDEIDSGLDVDTLDLVFSLIKSTLEKNNSILIITHYSRILKYIKPSSVHIMSNGKILESGNIELVNKIEQNGYKK